MKLKVLNLPQIEDRLCCSGIADVMNVDKFPQVISGYYLVRSCESHPQKELTAKQYQEYQNHILFGNISPIHQQPDCVVGVVYMSEMQNNTDSIWRDDAFSCHLRVEKSFLFINPYLIDEHQNPDLSNLAGLVKESLLHPYTEDDTLYIPLCEDLFIYIQEGENVFINITPSVAQVVTHLDGTIKSFNRVTLVCGKYNRSFTLDENSMKIEPDKAIVSAKIRDDDSKFLDLKITLGSEISPI